ncbi:MAG: FKBP-type peptidyl-prolyl cis-trans isomerase [Bacteroidetes bacterium]|nr:FKBP-type peptidyl-prolyl cis-trans isomerase [Bacteroidota bacterium]
MISNYMVLSKFLALFLTLALFSCNNQDKNKKVPDKKEIEDRMMSTNKMMLEIEQQEILDFIERYGWNVIETGSGLRYEIYHRGEGKKATEGDIAFLHYEIRLISGDLVYSSENDGVKSFKVGRGGVESGLEEGILLMRVGDKARLIMPPHLAHGVPGDGVKIPKRIPIIYYIELVDLN